MKKMIAVRTVLFALAFCLVAQSGIYLPCVLAQDNSKTQTANKALNEKLAKFLTGSRWEGQFTMTGEESPKKEQYEIIKAEKADEGDFWNLVVRIKYGEKDVTQPLPPIEIKWAGRTPIITVDNVAVPTLGTFDARVVVRKGSDGQPGKYAGTWSHGDVGGHLYGMIYRIDENSGDKARKDEEVSKGDSKEKSGEK